MFHAPQRAHTLVLVMGADTQERLADDLEHMANDIRRGQLTVGCYGSPGAGATYSYRVQPEQTHDLYFQQVDAWLAERAEGVDAPDEPGHDGGGDGRDA